MARLAINRAFMQATHIKKRLIFGFGFTLALLLVLLAVGLTTMAFMQQQLKDIVQNHNVKSELVSQMRQTEKERTIILYRLMNLVDPQSRDSDIKKFNELYKQFSVARSSLLSLGVTPHEKALLDKQSERSRQAVSLQDQVINNLVNGNLDQARSVLYDKALLTEEQVLNVLDELLVLQKNASQNAQSKATENYENARLLMIVIGIAVLLVGLAVAIVVIDRTMQAEASLFHQKEQAQVTLHSIGEGVITTNAEGKIIYINPVAQQLTGWSSENAKGQDLMTVFSIVDEEGATPKLDPVLKAIQEKVIVNSNEAMLLFREGGRHYAVEYTAAPIHDVADTVTGAVLVFRNITAMRNLAHQLSHQAMHDSLTGLINRREFEKRLERALRLSRSSNQRHV
ncbi:MAG: MCP four helix bundle domain-containing protein, partial [Gammaproteobacteria bacterium]